MAEDLNPTVEQRRLFISPAKPAAFPQSQMRDLIEDSMRSSLSSMHDLFADYVKEAYDTIDAFNCVNLAKCPRDCKQRIEHYHHLISQNKCSHALCTKLFVHLQHLTSCHTQNECQYCLLVLERKLKNRLMQASSVVEDLQINLTKRITCLDDHDDDSGGADLGKRSSRESTNAVHFQEIVDSTSKQLTDVMATIAKHARIDLSSKKFGSVGSHFRDEIVPISPVSAKPLRNVDKQSGSSIIWESKTIQNNAKFQKFLNVCFSHKDCTYTNVAIDMVNELLESPAQEVLHIFVSEAFRMIDSFNCILNSECTRDCQKRMRHINHILNDKSCYFGSCRLMSLQYKHINSCSQEHCEFCVLVHQRIKEIQRMRLGCIIRNIKGKEQLSNEKTNCSVNSAMLTSCIVKKRKLLNIVCSTSVKNIALQNFLNSKYYFQVSDHSKPPVYEPLKSSMKRKSVKKQVVVDKRKHAKMRHDATIESRKTMARDPITVVGEDISSKASRKLYDLYIRNGCMIVDAAVCTAKNLCKQVPKCSEINKHRNHFFQKNICKGNDLCGMVAESYEHKSRCNKDPCEYCYRIDERSYILSIRTTARDRNAAKKSISLRYNSIKRCTDEFSLVMLNDEIMQLKETEDLAIKELAELREHKKQTVKLIKKYKFNDSIIPPLPDH